VGADGEVVARERPRPILFYSHERGAWYGALYRQKARAFVPGFELAECPTPDARKFLYGRAGFKATDVPESTTAWAGRFDWIPGKAEPVTEDSASRTYFVNEWCEPPLRSQAIPSLSVPPTVRAVLLHVVGDDVPSYERLLNWLAVVYQTNTRTGTAWVLSGVEGTGKGVVVERIFRPLFGSNYVVSQGVSDFKRQFNPALAKCAIFNLDEAEIDRRDASAIEAQLRRLITEPTIDVEAKYENSRAVPNHANVLLTTNRAVVAHLSRSDRRFNVPPSQPRPITAVFPDTSALVATLAAEMPAFAGYLATVKADRQLARTAMVTDAKAAMVEAGETGPENFAHALKTGDLEWFLTSYFTVVDDGGIAAQDFAHALRKWCGAAGSVATVRCTDAVHAYNAIMGPGAELSAVALGKFLAKHGVRSSRLDSGRVRTYPVTWKALATPLSPTERAALGLDDGAWLS
jgi:hypothetical protein